MSYLIKISIENFSKWMGWGHKCFCCTKMIHKIYLLQLNPTFNFKIILFTFKNILNDNKKEDFHSNQNA